MKTHLVQYLLTVWAVMITTASYGQNNALTPGSADADRALREFKEGSKSSRSTMRNGILPEHPRDWAVGDIGELGQNAKIIQIIDKNRMLVRVDGPRDSYQRIVMLSGVSTEKWADGDAFGSNQQFEITKTTTYETASGGTKTVLLLECNTKRIKEIKAKLEADEKARQEAEAKRAKAKEDQKAAAEAARWRTWTIKGTGVRARFSGAISSTILLTKEDGEKLKVPLADLSAEDREWIAKRRE